MSFKNVGSILYKVPEPKRNEKGFILMTEEYICDLCEYQGHYHLPHLNSILYLHFKGIIELKKAFVRLKT